MSRAARKLIRGLLSVGDVGQRINFFSMIEVVRFVGGKAEGTKSFTRSRLWLECAYAQADMSLRGHVYFSLKEAELLLKQFI